MSCLPAAPLETAVPLAANDNRSGLAVLHPAGGVSNHDADGARVGQSITIGGSREALTYLGGAGVSSDLVRKADDSLHWTDYIVADGQVVAHRRLSPRFLSADPFVDHPFDLQNLNRYAYVRNNPLSLVDPSGYGWKGLGGFFRSIAGGRNGGIARAVIAVANQAVAVAVSGAVGGAVSTGTAKGALIGSATALAFYGVGSATNGHFGGANAANADAWAGSIDHFKNIAGHAAVGCASTAAQGGSCGSGALAAGFGAVVAPHLVAAELGVVQGTVASAMVGGVGSVLGGGKFQNGAVTASFGYLFNAAFSANRDLAAFGTDARPADARVTHTFVFTTKPDGTLADTYSWGNANNPEGWSLNQPEDIRAALQSIEKGYATKIAPDSMNDYYRKAYDNLNQTSNQHRNGIIFNNCKTEFNKLNEEAWRIWRENPGRR